MVPIAVDDEGVVAITGFTFDGETWQRSSLLYDVKTGSVSRPFTAGDQVSALSDDGNAAGASVTNGCWLLSGGVRSPVPLTIALGVNDRGQVVGFGGGFFPTAEIFNAADGSLTTLTLGGLQSVAAAINAGGQVAGSANPPGAQATHAFRWSQGTIQDLGTLPGCLRSSATAMNDGGQVVGYADLCGTGATRAFVYAGQALIDLNAVAPAAPDGFIYARPTGVNAEGTIVGLATSPDGFSYKPFLLIRVDDGD